MAAGCLAVLLVCCLAAAAPAAKLVREEELGYGAEIDSALMRHISAQLTTAHRQLMADTDVFSLYQYDAPEPPPETETERPLEPAEMYSETDQQVNVPVVSNLLWPNLNDDNTNYGDNNGANDKDHNAHDEDSVADESKSVSPPDTKDVNLLADNARHVLPAVPNVQLYLVGRPSAAISEVLLYPSTDLSLDTSDILSYADPLSDQPYFYMPNGALPELNTLHDLTGPVVDTEAVLEDYLPTFFVEPFGIASLSGNNEADEEMVRKSSADSDEDTPVSDEDTSVDENTPALNTNTSASNKDTSSSDEDMSGSDEDMSASDQSASASDENTSASDEDTSASYENTSASDEDTSASDNDTPASDEDASFSPTEDVVWNRKLSFSEKASTTETESKTNAQKTLSSPAKSTNDDTERQDVAFQTEQSDALIRQRHQPQEAVAGTEEYVDVSSVAPPTTSAPAAPLYRRWRHNYPPTHRRVWYSRQRPGPAWHRPSYSAHSPWPYPDRSRGPAVVSRGAHPAPWAGPGPPPPGPWPWPALATATRGRAAAVPGAGLTPWPGNRLYSQWYRPVTAPLPGGGSLFPSSAQYPRPAVAMATSELRPGGEAPWPAVSMVSDGDALVVTGAGGSSGAMARAAGRHDWPPAAVATAGGSERTGPFARASSGGFNLVFHKDKFWTEPMSGSGQHGSSQPRPLQIPGLADWPDYDQPGRYEAHLAADVAHVPPPSARQPLWPAAALLTRRWPRPLAAEGSGLEEGIQGLEGLEGIEGLEGLDGLDDVDLSPIFEDEAATEEPSSGAAGEEHSAEESDPAAGESHPAGTKESDHQESDGSSSGTEASEDGGAETDSAPSDSE